MKTCVIIAGGEIADSSIIEVHDYDTVICADSGYKYAKELGIVPDVIVGDFDSYQGELPENSEICRSSPEKDDTDTMLAVKLAIERGCNDITLYGALGGRFDHTFANIQTMIYAYQNGAGITIRDKGTLITVQGEGERIYPNIPDCYFSVFALTEKLHLTKLSGTKYQLIDYTISQNFPLGVSNEIVAHNAVVFVKSGLAMIVYTKK